MSTALFNLDSDGTLEILISRANIKKITRVMIAEPGRKTAKKLPSRYTAAGIGMGIESRPVYL